VIGLYYWRWKLFFLCMYEIFIVERGSHLPSTRFDW
jgi:hypothetical protein